MPPTLGKRPFAQAMPEPAPEPIQASAIVIIHPGSLNLRIGRAADAYPHIVPHCIARRHKQPGLQEQYEDPWLLRTEYDHPDAKQQQKTGLRLAEEAVRCRPMSRGDFRQPISYKTLYQMNHGSVAERTDIPSPRTWTSTHLKHEHIVGEEALYLHPNDCYNIHWPVRRGHINTHAGPSGTLSANIQDLETIWSTAIQQQLGIPLKDLKHYRAVLLIPDIFNRKHIKVMMDIILGRLGFSAAFAMQESVCATFGAGVSSACVIDVGDQKTSVSCVEDGLSQKPTRLCMEYGGSDITRGFHSLLVRSGFPYKECDLSRRADAMFAQELKEHYCHMESDRVGILSQTIQVKHPGGMIMKYSVNFGDETILAAMSLFYPDMFGLRGENLWHTAGKGILDPEDPHDDDYLTQTQSRQEQAARLVAARKKESAANEAKENNESSLLMDESQGLDDDEDTNDPPDILSETPAAGPGPSKAAKKIEEEVSAITLQGIVGIDQAILQSIDKCDSDDMKKRMYSCIVVVGGGAAMFEGAEAWIKYAVWTQMPPQFRLQLETMDVITKPKELDPRMACWKGGAILSCLDTAQELWIRQGEWKRYGVRMLRERSPFVW